MSLSAEDVLGLVPVMPVVAVDRVSDAAPVARALGAGGLPAIELTLRTPVALDAIRAIVDGAPDVVVGAGTITTAAQAAQAAAAGARFLVSPGSTPALLAAMEDTGLPFLAGVATVSEVMTMLAAGHTCMKLFPAAAAGGTPVPEGRRRAAAHRQVLPDRRHHPRDRAGLPRSGQRRLRRRLVAHARGRRRQRQLGPHRGPGARRRLPGRGAGMTQTIGIDIGGTKILGGVVDRSGRVLHRERVVSPASDPDAIEASVVALVGRLAAGRAIDAVGIAAAGHVDSRSGVVRFAPNIAWRNRDLRAAIEGRVGLPVHVENDANAAAWAEARFGAGRESDEMLMITVGTGVGGGMILHGRLHRGATGNAAEVGHVPVVPSGRLCGCGRLGCLEQYASGSAMVREAQSRSWEWPDSLVLSLAGDDAARIDGPMITAAAKRGDVFASGLIAEVGWHLGRAISSISGLVDPSLVVIGGGVSEAGDLLLDPIRTECRRAALRRGDHRHAVVRAAALGNDAGVIGVADLAHAHGPGAARGPALARLLPGLNGFRPARRSPVRRS